MYLKQTCNIEFKTQAGVTYRLRGLHHYEAKKSVHQIVQTCKITLPLSVLMQNNDLLQRTKLIDKIQEGDKITIYLGYNGNNKKEFEGYIKRINPKMPLELECEDEMYLLRKIRLKRNFQKNDIKEVIAFVLEELEKQQQLRIALYANMPQVTVFNFWMKEANGVTVLQELEDKYMLNSYLTEIDGVKTLYVGLMYGLKKNTVKYAFNQNTINLDDLKYNRPGERTLKIELRHIGRDGKEQKYVFGDPKGENTISVPHNGNASYEDLKHHADAIMQQQQSGGYKGSFTTFLIPKVEPADVADCVDDQFASRSGQYYISTVTTTFGNGATRKPELEIRL